MADNQTVNASASYSVKTTELADSSHVQHFRLDLGSGTTSSAVSGSVPTLTGLSVPAYDYLEVAYPVATTEVYTFKTGGSGGTTVATVTVIYTDATKQDLSSVTKV